MVAWSCSGHVAALVLALVVPGEGAVAPPHVIDVELLGLPAPAPPAPPAAAPAPPAPAPPQAEPAPPPPPPPPEPDTVVLPEKPRDPEPKPEARPKPKPKPKPREREVFREPEKQTEKSLEELMAEMRGEQAAESDLEQVVADLRGQHAEAEALAEERSGGPPSPLSPAERAWHRGVRQHMKGLWILPAGFRTQVLETTVSVRLDAAGNILGDPEVVRRSGNPWYDDSVLRGLAKASPLPTPPAAGKWQLVFRPEDSF